MEQDKEQHPKKRSYALPITLLLLVFSLTGNVFLYSQSLQGGLDKKYDKGKDVIGAATQAVDYYQAVLDDIFALLEGKTAEAGTVIRDAAGVADFVQQSHSFDEEDAFDPGSIYSYMIDVDNSVAYIKQQDGKLTAEQTEYLKSVQDVYTKQLTILKEFNFDADKNRSGTIQIGAGIGWLELANQLEQSIKEHQSSIKYSAQ
ncbi:hypothetical protein [Paenibacillus glycanilyticus]|uniref:Methyl-accepting chemotaxis protein n=1 Tax=Paenibacillus glycanilyticus TaxID=126569 RepID=A0ABQ6GJF1_9BACL|nr:hypothetical protein [Paenibacillus glycanilyticus]GLX69172.1 hypothetical protein MU1_35170 [Paenibacillus glycanilyticus]